MGQLVNILLSTYNGIKYVDELIDSIMNQDCDCFKLLIRDDGSTDGTGDVLFCWEQKYPEKITVVRDSKGNLGVTCSMLELVKTSDAPYMIFCDQDDVWFRQKVRTLLRAIRYKEKQYPDIPIIVHCEAYTTDENLHLIGKDSKTSLQGYQSGRNKMQTSFTNLLLCNPVQGASMIFNQKLKQELEPVLELKIKRSLVYDSVITSVCSIRGKIFFLNRPLMYYRQHAHNVVGAKKMYLWRFKNYTEKEQNELKTSNFLLLNRSKCELIKRCYWNMLDERQKKILTHFMNASNDWSAFWKLNLAKEFSMRQILIMMWHQID
jgi:rhamnosyltransferase